MVLEGILLDKTIITAGLIIIALGIGFIVTGAMYQDLHEAYGIGGFLWFVVGAITTGFGIKARREKIRNLDAMR